MKRIALFCDGTWNTPDQYQDGRLCQTNVVKLANSLSPNSEDGTEQVLFYDIGIGAEGNQLSRMIEGATGRGISSNILQAYAFLMNNYIPGDEIFLFGFSRGAFTVRSLAGLIRNSGILEAKYVDHINKAYSLYRSRHPSFHPKGNEATLFRKTFAIEDITRIKFIGVWDTVGALGNPLFMNGIVSPRNEFHDTELSSKIDNAYHALAIDEKRENFQDALWHQQQNSEGQVLEQVWFPGVHSDIGGGYISCALSDIALQWMMEKAGSCKLKFNPVHLHPDPLGILHISMFGIYKLKKNYYRPIGVSVPGKGLTHEKLHSSVLERYKNDPSYRPPNLADYFQRNPDQVP